MESKKFIGKYEIECEISAVSQRHIYFATQKQVLKESLENQKDSLQNEYEILNSTVHPNIVKAVNFFEVDDKYYMVTPRADIDLFEYMTDQEISTDIIPKIMQNLFSAVSFLHSKGIWHRNISADNVLVYKQNLFVLCGFSHAGYFKGTRTDEIHGNPLYMAPELNSEQGCMFLNYKKIFKFTFIQKVLNLNFFFPFFFFSNT